MTTDGRRLERIEEKLDRLLDIGLDRPLSVRKPRAAALLGVSVTTLDRMIARGALRTVTVSGRSMLPMHELLRVTSLPAKREALRFYRVGGLRFLRVGRLPFSFCVARKSAQRP